MGPVQKTSPPQGARRRPLRIFVRVQYDGYVIGTSDPSLAFSDSAWIKEGSRVTIMISDSLGKPRMTIAPS
jgi:hypothetical protein